MPIPTFTPNVPIGTQTLGQTVTAVNDNFGNYNGVTSVNHGAPNSSVQGKHTFVEMPVQSTPPTTLSGEGGLFTQSAGSPSQSEMFYQRDSNATNYQMTGPFLGSTSGYTTLFGGVIFQWAAGSMSTGGSANTFPLAFPNACFGVVAVPVAGSVQTVTVTSFSKTGFAAFGSAASGIFYFAIGN